MECKEIKKDFKVTCNFCAICGTKWNCNLSNIIIFDQPMVWGYLFIQAVADRGSVWKQSSFADLVGATWKEIAHLTINFITLASLSKGNLHYYCTLAQSKKDNRKSKYQIEKFLKANIVYTNLWACSWMTSLKTWAAVCLKASFELVCQFEFGTFM